MEELCEIAWGLGLKEEGVKKDYIKAIKHYLDAHPELRDNERWAGLFDRRCGGDSWFLHSHCSGLNNLNFSFCSQGGLFASQPVNRGGGTEDSSELDMD